MPKLRLHNTLTRKLETFEPFNSNLVKVYTCGPTVYSQPHVGNFAAYVYWDLMVRTLEANDYKVERVINLTDVGHLVSDGDDGEDKLEKGARKSGKTVWEVAEYYISAFQKDFRRLQLREPTSWARATDYINEDIAIVNLFELLFFELAAVGFLGIAAVLFKDKHPARAFHGSPRSWW